MMMMIVITNKTISIKYLTNSKKIKAKKVQVGQIQIQWIKDTMISNLLQINNKVNNNSKTLQSLDYIQKYKVIINKSTINQIKNIVDKHNNNHKTNCLSHKLL